MGRQERFPYEERFDLVLSYVYEHLDEPLDLVRLAGVAGMSPRHWHRVFSAAFGETLPNLVKRVRMQRALALLADNVSISDVASQCGYPNVSSFTRAFRSAVGVTPARYRMHGTYVDLRIARINGDPLRYPVRDVNLPSTPCVAMRHRGSFFTIDRAFHDLRIWLRGHDIDLDSCQMYGVYLSDPSRTPEREMESLASASVPESFAPELRALSPNAPAPERYTLRSGKYAVLTHVGAYADMPESYAWLFGCWLPASGRTLTSDPVVEHYLSPPQVGNPAIIRTDLMLPVPSG